ncbi:MAG: hypothetical protein HUK14_08865 [Muribaculaceae bacterium]|nr:hypothetical protein [Muribaculaceae bacterium]
MESRDAKKLTPGQRVQQVVAWLTEQKIIVNKTDLAEQMGYSLSGLSQIMHDRVPVTLRFAHNIKRKVDNRINVQWLLTGEGNMLTKDIAYDRNGHIRNFGDLIDQLASGEWDLGIVSGIDFTTQFWQDLRLFDSLTDADRAEFFGTKLPHPEHP